jgi:hypothetical protein
MRLTAYNQEHKASSSDTVQTALESFLVAKGYLAKPKKSFNLSPAPKGSGYTDTSINHDAVLAEFTLVTQIIVRSKLESDYCRYHASLRSDRSKRSIS